MRYPEQCKSRNCGKITCPQDCVFIDNLWEFRKQSNAKVEYSFDNSYMPASISIYCGRCGEYVGDIGSLDELPLKKDELCAECQDALDT